MVAMAVFLAVLPLILSLEGTRALLLRLKLGHILPKASTWANIGWLWVMGPATLILLIFGVLARGNAGNMRTAHGVSIPDDIPVTVFKRLTGLPSLRSSA